MTNILAADTPKEQPPIKLWALPSMMVATISTQRTWRARRVAPGTQPLEFYRMRKGMIGTDVVICAKDQDR